MIRRRSVFLSTFNTLASPRALTVADREGLIVETRDVASYAAPAPALSTEPATVRMVRRGSSGFSAWTSCVAAWTATARTRP